MAPTARFIPALPLFTAWKSVTHWQGARYGLSGADFSPFCMPGIARRRMASDRLGISGC
jgi:hypothetical protein